MARIAFIGAGSVVFTKNLLGDILSLPELRSVEIALHDIDPDRLATAEAMARYVAARARRLAGDHRPCRPAGRARRCGLRDQHGADRRPRGDLARLRDPGALRTAADDRGHARDRRHLPDAAHGRPHARARARDGRPLPTGLAAQLHEPDGDAVLARLRRHADAERRRPLPLGAVHDRGPGRARRGACRGGRRSSPRGSTTRRSSFASSATGRISTRASTSASPPIRSSGGACGFSSTAGSATSRPSRASTPRSTCRGSCGTTTRSSDTGSRSTSTSAAARRTSPSTSA